MNGAAGIGDNMDGARIVGIVDELRRMLRARRRSKSLAREELAAATTLGWVELTLLADTPVVKDLEAEAGSAAERLRLIGDRVGMPSHSRSTALFALATELSTLLRAIESDLLVEADIALLHAGSPLAETSRRVISEWSAATGRVL